VTDSADPGLRFERTFRRAYPEIAAYCRRRCPPGEADDAATEVFAIAWRRREDLPPEPEDRLWLFGVARRVVANHARAARRREGLLRRLRDEPVRHSPGDEATAETVRQALRELSPSDREMLLLSAWEGLAVAEMAIVLGVPARVVSVRLHRARKRLARVLEGPAASPSTLAPERQS